LHGWKIFIFLEQICIYTPKQGIIEDVDDQAETIIRLSSWDQQIKIHKMLRLVSFFTIIIGFLFFSLWQPFLATGRPTPLPSKFKSYTSLTTSQAESPACLLYPMTTRRSIIEAATVGQKIDILAGKGMPFRPMQPTSAAGPWPAMSSVGPSPALALSKGPTA
jgi:hypothetical protein